MTRSQLVWTLGIAVAVVSLSGCGGARQEATEPVPAAQQQQEAQLTQPGQAGGGTAPAGEPGVSGEPGTGGR